MPVELHALLDAIAQTVPVIAFEWDLRSNAVSWSGDPKTLAAWGLRGAAAPVDGHGLLGGVHPEDVLPVRRALRQALRGERPTCDLSHRRAHRELGWRRVRGFGQVVPDAEGQPARLVGAWIDAREDAAEEAWHNARHDPLTGLPNRAALADALARAVDRSSHLGVPGGLLLIDLDRFRSINRGIGPHAGDALLCLVSERLRELAPARAFLARVGADQFAMVLGPEAGASEIEAVASRAVEALARPVEVADHEVVTGASIGLVRLDGHTSEPVEVLRDAENALARAKEAGGNRWSPFIPEPSHASDRLSLEARLRHAIDEGTLSLHYQPIVSLPTRGIVGFEALIRWNDPVLGRVSPGRFIPIAEETGLIVPIGQWVLEEACRTLHAWRGTEVGESVRLNVNLSAVQFRQEDLVERIDALLYRFPRSRGHLNLELTETALLERPSDQVAVLEQLRSIGCELHVDDFGTGWSSLSNLVRLPVDALKVDREFVCRAEEDRKSLAVVRMVARMAQEMGLSLTAEGIETEGQVLLLNALGRCRGQGYLFSRPVPRDEAFDILCRPTTQVLEPTLLREAG